MAPASPGSRHRIARSTPPGESTAPVGAYAAYLAWRSLNEPRQPQPSERPAVSERTS
ncbi:hypothetical protein [Microbacterium sp. TPD7012]|uniref:hypothetical protein n=1 Tax=Microbacterium sp. TPD7012 TaxID=2171975 RepID=UPI0014025C53|nr:hypothetical protein [Microbacterium sp. TPD7012]